MVVIRLSNMQYLRWFKINMSTYISEKYEKLLFELIIICFN
jgi:hypothetical protein